MPYIVDVSAPLPDDLEPVVEVIARAFDIAPEKAAKLIARAPGAITRPVSEREARAVAQVVAAAGLDVHVREVEGSGDRSAQGGEAGGARTDDTTDRTARERVPSAADEADPSGPSAVDREDDASAVDRSSDADRPSDGVPASHGPSSDGSGRDADAPSTNAAASDGAGEGTASDESRPDSGPSGAPPPVAPDPDAPPLERSHVASPDPEPEAGLAGSGAVPRTPGRPRTIAAAVLPVVVALLVALGAVIGILYPNWRSDAADAAAREARALTVAVDASIDAGGVALDEATPATEALTTAEAMRALAGPVRASRRALEPEGYAFVLVTGPDAERRAGWPTPRDLDPVLADAAQRAVRGEPIDGAPIPWGLGAIVTVEGSTRVDAASGRFEIAVAPLERDGIVLGNVVIGAPGGAADARLRSALQITAGAGAALLLVALVLGAALGGTRTRPRG